jgi:hypothetical protein
MARPARHPPFGEGYEQARSASVEQGIGQEQQPRLTIKDRKTIPAELKSPQEHGSANFKIPTLKRASNRPGDTNAASQITHTEGPFMSDVPFGKSFFPIQFASSLLFQPTATGEFFVELRSIEVSYVHLCLWLVPSHLTCLL